MKLKEKFQRFWTLSKSHEGFTLVELIVVIAILAILAGVAIPVYNGYIKKAQTAADQTLLDSVNTAFVAACMENGISQYDVKSAVIPVNDNGTIGTTTNSGVSYFTGLSFDENTSANANEINASFAFYYDGNQAAAFNTMKGALVFNPETGMFGEDTLVSYSYNGNTIYVSASTAALMKESTFGTAIGAENLLNRVDYVTRFASELTDDPVEFAEMMGGDEYLYSFAESMGIEVESGLTGSELYQAVGMTLVNEGIVSGEEEVKSAMVNSAVLYAAQNATSQSSQDIINLLTSGNAKSTINNNNDAGSKLAQAALAYGMYTAYAYDNGDSDLIASTNDPMAILNAIDGDEDFQNYLASNQATTDLDAYLAALGTISDASTDSSAASDILLNGFGSDNAALLKMVQSIMGE